MFRGRTRFDTDSEELVTEIDPTADLAIWDAIGVAIHSPSVGELERAIAQLTSILASVPLASLEVRLLGLPASAGRESRGASKLVIDLRRDNVGSTRPVAEISFGEGVVVRRRLRLSRILGRLLPLVVSGWLARRVVRFLELPRHMPGAAGDSMSALAVALGAVAELLGADFASFLTSTDHSSSSPLAVRMAMKVQGSAFGSAIADLSAIATPTSLSEVWKELPETGAGPMSPWVSSALGIPAPPESMCTLLSVRDALGLVLGVVVAPASPPSFLTALVSTDAPLLHQVASVVSSSVESDLHTALRAAKSGFLAATDDVRFTSYWDAIASITADALDCEACSYFLLNSEGLLELRGTTGMVGGRPYSEITYAVGEGATGTTFSLREGWIYLKGVASARASQHHSLHREVLKSSEKSKSIVFAPLFDSLGICRGVVRCNNKRASTLGDSGLFALTDLRLLEALTDVSTNAALRDAIHRVREAELDEFLHRLRHEIAEPMSGVLAQAEWIANAAGDLRSEVPERAAALEQIRLKAGDILVNTDIVASLLESQGNPEPGEIEDIDLAELLNRIVAPARGKCARIGIDLSFDPNALPRDARRVRGSPVHLGRVFYNLLANAIKYRDEQERARFVRISFGREPQDSIELRFEDNGLGFTKTEAARAFEKHYRSERVKRIVPSGIGLGLYEVRRIVQFHGGHVEVTHLAKPTTITLQLPLSHAAAARTVGR